MITKPLTLQKPVMTLYEDGEWLRIETELGTRYMPKAIARRVLAEIGKRSVVEKTNIVLIA